MGEADFTVPVPAFAAATGAFQDTGASTVLDLPDSVSVSAYHQLDDRFAVLGDITWTHWSRFDQIVVRFDNPRQPDLVTPQDWEDAFRYALGVRYHAEGPATLRVGAAYDETPVPDPRLRSPRIPDQDRVWLTFGASYRYSEAIALDFAYAHLFIDDARVENTEVITGHVLNGDFDGEIDIVAAQLVWHMRALRVSTRTFGSTACTSRPQQAHPNRRRRACASGIAIEKPQLPPELCRPSRFGAAAFIGYAVALLVVPAALARLVAGTDIPVAVSVIASVPLWLLAQQGLHLLGLVGHEGLHLSLARNRYLSAGLGIFFSSMIINFMEMG
jgi:hypothetical protein